MVVGKSYHLHWRNEAIKPLNVLKVRLLSIWVANKIGFSLLDLKCHYFSREAWRGWRSCWNKEKMIVLASHSHFAILRWCTLIFEKWIVCVCVFGVKPNLCSWMFLLCYIGDKGQSWGTISTFYHFILVGMGGIVKIRKKTNTPRGFISWVLFGLHFFWVK